MKNVYNRFIKSIKNTLSIAAAIASVSLANAKPEETAEQTLLIPGSYHGDEVNSKSGERWFALEDKSAKCLLRQATLRVRQEKDFVSNDMTGKNVGITEPYRPTFLVRRLLGLKVGEVSCAKVSPSSKEVSLKQPLSLVLASTKYSIKMTNTPKPGSEYSEYRLTLSNGKMDQILDGAKEARFPEDMQFSLNLIWAGDLDHDGKLDLLINTSFGDNCSQPTLFLSSGAARGKLVRKFATFTSFGC